MIKIKKAFIFTTFVVLIILLTNSNAFAAYDNPPIPNGFTHTIGSWDTGFVINDPAGNEWVWVPVGNISGGFVGREWIGQGDPHTWIIDPVTAPVTNAISVQGGFYVMRYEASNNGGKVQSKANQPAWNFANTATSISKAGSMGADWSYPANVSTHLIYDTEWDTIVKWMEAGGANVTNSTSWGNYSNDPVTGGNGLMNTGARSEFQSKNIFDMAGNMWEWTQGYSGVNESRRGGCYASGGTIAAAYRDRNTATDSGDYISFRAAFVVLPINTPATATPTSADVANYSDGRDIQVTFNGANDETNISEYRIFVVPSGSAGAFNQSTASGLDSTRYVAEAKNGANGAHTLTLTQTLLDSNGAAIVNGNTYKIFVLAVAQNGYVDTLSAASGALPLVQTVAPSPGTPTGTDIANNGDGRDIRVTFNGASDETNISGYEIFVVPSAGSLIQSTASGLAAQRYVAEAKSGANGAHTVTLTQGLKDSTGASIANGSAYKIYVLSVAQNGYTDAMSSASGNFSLLIGSAPAVSQPLASDAANNGDGRDIKVVFRGANNEVNISGYRIYVVPSASAGSFNATTASGLGSSMYVAEGVSGPKVVHTVTLTQGLQDSTGAGVTTGTAYKAFILAVGQGGYGDSLSPASQTFTLVGSTSGSTTILSQIAAPKAYDIANHGDGSDIKVTFKSLYNEDNVSVYRIIVVPSASEGTFDLTAANGVIAARYYSVSKTGPRKTRTVTLPNTLLDSGGAGIANGTAYRVFVLAVATSGSSDSTLSPQSPAITLSATVPSVSTVTRLSAADITNNNDASDIQVKFTALINETNVQEYRIFIVPSASAGSFNLTAANGNTHYYTDAKTTARAQHIVTLDPTLVDSSGGAIANSNTYKVFVLTIGQNSYANRLSTDADVGLN